ncbi:MAG TPA: tetratricopeptide repeat protein [Thermoanaerobaculia bacterium]|nr:tetratricopeptide repeat protein [Thermoanaerobaculia bacterium]
MSCSSSRRPAAGASPGARGKGPGCPPRRGCPPRYGLLAARLPAALGLAGALGLAAAASAAADSTTVVPKSMQQSSSASGVATSTNLPTVPSPALPPPAPAPPAADDPWAGVLFNTADPWAPGAVPPQGGRRPGAGFGIPGGPRDRPGLAPPAAPVAPLAPGEKPKPERVQALYRQVLVHWAEGKAEKAWSELAALETAVVNDKDPTSAKRLLRAEEKVIDQVAGADLEVLLPIARLHFEVFQLYSNENAKGHALVENHSRAMVHDLAILYRQQSGSQGAALVASHLLTTLAELLQRGSQHQTAATLYTEAAALDPHNVVPALRLGVTYEKFEQYQAAAEWLRKVLAIDPKNAEARLRLAVNLGRLHKAAEAATLLEGLIAEASDSWVKPVAIQELARIEERQEAFARAEQVLRAGLERFPTSIRLRVQLAALLDRQGKIREGRQLVEEIPALEVGTVEEGARFRYNNTTADSVAVSRSFFEQNASSRMRVLAEALAKTAAAPAEAAAAPPGQAPNIREQRP